MYDVHTHFVPQQVMEWLLLNQKQVNASWIVKDPAKAPFLNVNGSWEFELKEAFLNAELYLQEQERAGIEHSLVSPIPQLFLYDFDAELTAELSAVYNDSMARLVKQHSQRLSGLATLPMNAPERAAQQLKKAMANGLRGAIIASSWDGNMLSHEQFTPFWEEADRERAIIFIHPLLCTDPRLSKKNMTNLIGVPWETTISGLDLMLNGHLDKYPNVRILLAHGGGFLPYQVGRVHTGYSKWKAISEQMQASPFDYLRRFWYDSVLWNPAALQYLVEVAGADRVVQGTDYPFDLSEWPPCHCEPSGFITLMEP